MVAFLFDDDDSVLANCRSWRKDKQGYWFSTYRKSGRRFTVRFHREVIGAQRGQAVDHINHDASDNRKQNLRIVSCSVNGLNRKNVVKPWTKAGFLGVNLLDDKPRKRPYQARISIGRKARSLGCFATAEEAAETVANARREAIARLA